MRSQPPRNRSYMHIATRPGADRLWKASQHTSKVTLTARIDSPRKATSNRPTGNYCRCLLSGQLLTGLGVGLILPTLSSVVGSALPGPRWGSGSSLLNTARQVGSALGIALVVTAVGTHIANSPTELASIRSGWAL